MTVPVLLAVLALVAVGAVLLTVLLGVWQRPTRTRLSSDGFQELEVVVKGRYLPDLVEAKRGIPVRLQFRREEDTPCSERVIFSDFLVGARLPAYQTTAVSFIPTKCGEFLFTCAFGMYQGRLVIVEPGKRDLERVRVTPTGWDAPPGGHHRSGTLTFPATVGGKPLLDASTKYLELVIRDVAGVKERVIRWNLEVKS